MTTETLPAVRAYLARVRTALADLPATEVDDVVEDVRPHLAQITEELGDEVQLEGLIERLGTPESYAAELRAAGDYPAPPAGGSAPARETRFGPRLALWSMLASAIVLAGIGLGAGAGLESSVLLASVLVVPVLLAGVGYIARRGTDKLADLPEFHLFTGTSDAARTGHAGPVRRYLRSLLPAVWPLCAVVFVGLALALALDGSTLIFLAVPLLAVATGLALWAGPKSASDRRMLWASLPVAALAIGAFLGVAGHFADAVVRSQYPVAQQYIPARNMMHGNPQLYYGERRLTNLYVFDSEGNPLSDVYIYDAQGRPILVPREDCDPATPGSRQRDNEFPRPRVEMSYQNGERVCRKVEGVPFTVAVPEATQSSEPTTTSPARESGEQGETTSKAAEPTGKGTEQAPTETTEQAKPTE